MRVVHLLAGVYLFLYDFYAVAGAHQIIASYGGSAVYSASTSQTLVQNVSKK